MCNYLRIYNLEITQIRVSLYLIYEYSNVIRQFF